MPPRPNQAFANSDPDVPGPKRRRIALACNACRTRKSRCNGQRPTCSACSQLNFDCQYDAPDSATNVIVRKEYVTDLEHRLKQVENLLQRHDDLLTGHLSPCTPASNVLSESQNGELLHHRSPDHPNGGIQLDESGLEGPSSDNDESRTDGLAITFVDERASVYFGESSNIQFIRYLLQALSRIWKIKRPERPTNRPADSFNPNQLVQVPGEYSPLGMEPAPSSGLSMSVLPPAAEIEDLLRVYFRSMGLLFPFLHEPTFWDTYRQFKDGGFLKVRRTWLGLLNMIMAMAINIDGSSGVPANERMDKSLSFYARGVALCSAPSVRTVSLDIVHYLLLQVLYLQGTPRSIQAWTIHGLLGRAATALGLHCDYAGKHLSAIEQEVRRRTWHTIYCVDKVMSANFGRPSAISDEQYVVPLPEVWLSSSNSIATRRRRDDEDLMQHTANFFALSTRLYQIMGQSLRLQYDGNIGSQIQGIDEIATIQTAGNLRQKLKHWVATLPEHLAILQPDSPVILQKSLLNKLQTILTIRYHNVNILVHRPLLCATLQYMSRNESSPDSKLPYATQLAMAEADECVASAESTIDIVFTILNDNTTDNNNLGVWFFTLYYVFTSSLTVCASLLWAQHGKRKDAADEIASGRSYLTKAAEALNKLDQGNHLVNQCSKYIRYLSQLQNGRFNSTTSRRTRAPTIPDERAPLDEDATSSDDVLSSTEFAELSELLGEGEDFGAFLTADLFNPNLFDTFLPS